MSGAERQRRPCIGSWWRKRSSVHPEPEPVVCTSTPNCTVTTRHEDQKQPYPRKSAWTRPSMGHWSEPQPQVRWSDRYRKFVVEPMSVYVCFKQPRNENEKRSLKRKNAVIPTPPSSSQEGLSDKAAAPLARKAAAAAKGCVLRWPCDSGGDVLDWEVAQQEAAFQKLNDQHRSSLGACGPWPSPSLPTPVREVSSSGSSRLMARYPSEGEMPGSGCPRTPVNHSANVHLCGSVPVEARAQRA